MNYLVNDAVTLLKEHEPSDGYYGAFSGGKDSVVIKHLAKIAGVKVDWRYNNTTIDPPELVKFIKSHHSDVKWNQPKHGSMMHRVATKRGTPPTRMVRWCCSEYKEQGGNGMVKIIGVRAAESKARARRWGYVSEHSNGDKVVCPIVYWSDSDVWSFIKYESIPYCSLYDEGFTRLGCVGCPLNPVSQKREFERWPIMAKNWEKAVKKNWENYHLAKRRDGKPYYQANFKTAEDFWQWWLTAKAPDYMRGDCQSMLLFTNEDVSDHEKFLESNNPNEAINKLEEVRHGQNQNH